MTIVDFRKALGYVVFFLKHGLLRT